MKLFVKCFTSIIVTLWVVFCVSVVTIYAVPANFPVLTPIEDLQREVLVIHITWEGRSTICTGQVMGEIIPALTGEQIYNLIFGRYGSVVKNYYRDVFGVTKLVDVVVPAFVWVPMPGVPTGAIDSNA